MDFATRVTQWEWLFYEKGLQMAWNELRRFAAVSGIGTTEMPSPTPDTAPGWGFGQQQNPPPANIRPPTLTAP
jgi:hypothetical protein